MGSGSYITRLKKWSVVQKSTAFTNLHAIHSKHASSSHKENDIAQGNSTKKILKFRNDISNSVTSWKLGKDGGPQKLTNTSKDYKNLYYVANWCAGWAEKSSDKNKAKLYALEIKYTLKSMKGRKSSQMLTARLPRHTKHSVMHMQAFINWRNRWRAWKRPFVIAAMKHTSSITDSSTHHKQKHMWWKQHSKKSIL
jgi:hypothetical protein